MPAIGCWLPAFDATMATSVARAPASLPLVIANVSTLCSVILLRWRGFRFRSFLAVAPVEPIHAAGRIDQFLLAGKERMAGRTNFDMQIAFACRTGFEGLATGAGNGYLAIFRVNSRLHFISRLLWLSFSRLIQTANDTGHGRVASSRWLFEKVSRKFEIGPRFALGETSKISRLTTA
jgi:hypothetical protein